MGDAIEKKDSRWKIKGMVWRKRIFTSAGIFKQSMGARDRVGRGLSYLHARLHRLAELIPRNRFWAL